MLKDSLAQVSVFWVHAGSRARFEQDYRKLSKLVDLPGCDDPKEDIRPIVKGWFESPRSGEWILVLDNAIIKPISSPRRAPPMDWHNSFLGVDMER